MPEVLILTGPPGAGKSTTAEALAERYDRVAHVQVDAIHEFITPTGHVHPWGPAYAWARQQRLLTRSACCLTRNFLEDRFAVIIDDVVIEREHVEQYIAELRTGGASVHFVRLLPSLDACLERNRGRRVEERMPPKRVEAVYRAFEAAHDPPGVTIDSTELTPHATADKLQELTTTGKSLVWRPGSAVP